MTTEVKKFLKGIDNANKQILDFLPLNLMTFSIAEVKRNKDGSVSFTSITDFHLIEEVTLSQDEQKVWDLFNDFNTPKNASNVIADCIANKRSVTAETYKQQGKITAPEKYDFRSVQTFSQFWAMLDEAERGNAIKLANQWLHANHIDQTSFDFFFINGTNGVEVKAGDYLMTYDATYGQKLATRVLQVSPNGFVTCLDNGGYFTLSAGSQPEVVEREVLPSEILEILDKTFDKITEDANEHKTYRIEQAIKRADRQAKIDAKAQAKADRQAKRDAEAKAKADARKQAKAELMKMELNTPEAIKEAVQRLNGAKLQKEQIAEVRTRIKEAKAELKQQAEADKKAKQETEAKTEATPKATKRTKKAPAKAKGKETAKKMTKLQAESEKAMANHI